MEANILKETLIYYACQDDEGYYKPITGREHVVFGRKIKLYKNREIAEKYGKQYGCSKVTKVKLVEIE